jgi:hypothetical protein
MDVRTKKGRRSICKYNKHQIGGSGGILLGRYLSNKIRNKKVVGFFQR